MKPVFQTRTGADTGNCTEACIASVLECELRDVPDLCECGTRRPDWDECLRAWLRSRGLVAVVANAPSPLPWPFNWNDVPDGLHSLMLPRKLLLGGHNTNGVPHYLALHGRQVHDPNPSQSFLATWEELRFFMPVDEARHHWGDAADWPGIEMDWK